MSLSQYDVAEAVLKELDKATKKFPHWPNDPLHAVAILGEEFGELTQAVLQMTYEPEKVEMEDIYKEAKQTAAMAIRFLMSIPDYDFEESPQHECV